VFRRIHRYTGAEVDLSRWPATVPTVAQILADGLDLETGVTVLAGENGAGKSTVVEAIAEACGLNPQGGSAKAKFQTRQSEPGIGSQLWAERGPGYPAWTYFLRGHHAWLVHLSGRQSGPQARAVP
jgi:predicted ATPase